MAEHGTWHRRGFTIVAASIIFGSLTIWATQVAITTPVSAAPVGPSPYFAGTVTRPPLMLTRLGGGDKIYTESAGVSFKVPMVTCPASGVTSYAIFQYLEGQTGEAGFPLVYLYCDSGTFSAGMFTGAETGNGTSGGCANVPVAPGDSISFSEQDRVFRHDSQIPAGTIDIQASDSTNGESTECSSPTTFPPFGEVYTGICDWVPTTGPLPPHAPPPPPIGACGSTKVSSFNSLFLSGLQVDNEPVWHWPTQIYDMYRYRQVGSTTEPILQVYTQRLKLNTTLEFIFIHH
jgi:hypothetical protein